MKSCHVFFCRAFRLFRSIARHVIDDQIAVHAAQASFFVIISFVPFVSLLLGVIGILLPDQPDALTDLIPGVAASSGFLDLILDDLRSAPAFSLLSISALTTLWTSSRGIAAIRYGLETVYETDHRSYVKHQYRSIVATLVFIAVLVASVVVLLFGDLLSETFGETASQVFSDLRTPLFLVLLTTYITAMYLSIARRSTAVSHRTVLHLPGAVLSAVGWGVYSFLYSLYIRYFPDASRIYGSLGAVCLLMVWVYFCMMILLFGAEFNKLFFAGRFSCLVKNGK